MNGIHDLLGAYCTDALDPHERAAFEDHLASCGQCRDEAADFREVLAALADAHPVHPPSSLEEAVVAAARTRTDAGSAATAADSPEPGARAADDVGEPPALARLVPAWRRAAPWLVAAAAGCLLFAAGVGLGRAQIPAGPAAPVGELAAVVAVASAADAQVLPVDLMGTTSRLVVSSKMDQAVFLASELPTPAKGMVYQVWRVAEDGQMISAGCFKPAADGHLIAVLDGGTTGVTKYMVTIEPPGGSTHPSGAMLAEIGT